MTLRKFLYASHKWLAVVTGVFTFFWFASAVAMLLPRDLFTRPSEPAAPQTSAPEAATGTGPPFGEISVTIPQAIASLESATSGAAVARNVRVESFEGRLSYRIETESNGVWWINATDGTLTTVDADVARRLVVATGLADDTLGPGERLVEHGPGYAYGPVPAYRFTQEGRGLVFIVDPATGEVQPWSSLRRWYRFITGWHTLDFLRPFLGGQGVGLLMWMLSIAGTGMTLFGMSILWLQFRQWQRSRRRG